MRACLIKLLLVVLLSVPMFAGNTATETLTINIAPPQHRVTVQWSYPTTNGVTFFVYRDGAHWGQSTTLNYVDLEVTAGSTYSYTVSAYVNGQESAQSSPPATATVPQP